jgi:hypothetical protein
MSHENSTSECGLIKSEHVRLILVKDTHNDFVEISRKNKPSQENKARMQHDPSESCKQKTSLPMNDEKILERPKNLVEKVMIDNKK